MTPKEALSPVVYAVKDARKAAGEKPKMTELYDEVARYFGSQDWQHFLREAKGWSDIPAMMRRRASVPDDMRDLVFNAIP